MEYVTKLPTSEVHYWEYGQNNSKVILMIHGFTGNHEGFKFMLPDLQNYRVIIPDLPGFGKSTIAKQDWSIDGIANLTNAFVSTLSLSEPPILFGHSMGGLVASSMVAQQPNLFSHKVALLSPVPTKISLFDSRWLGAKLGELQYWVGHYIPVIGPKIVKSKLISAIVTKRLLTTNDPDLQNKIYQEHYNNLDRISSIHFYHVLERDINRKGSINYAESLRQKDLLIISGDVDDVAPLNQMKKLVEVSQADFKIIHGVSHLAHYERPNEVTQAIEAFIA